MKLRTIALFLIASVVLLSCEKEINIGGKISCKLADSEVCTGNDFMDYYNVPAGYERYVLESIVVDPSCGCITEGYVKYLKNGETQALVDYGNGECDAWAVVTLCSGGDCDNAATTCCKFEQECESGN